MSIRITITVESCKACMYCTNSSREHDDAFSSAPYPIRWYCDFGGRLRLLDDDALDTIDGKCPFKT